MYEMTCGIMYKSHFVLTCSDVTKCTNTKFPEMFRDRCSHCHYGQFWCCGSTAKVGSRFYGQFSTHAFSPIVDVKMHSSITILAPILVHIVLPLNHVFRQFLLHGANTFGPAWHSCLHPTLFVREHWVIQIANSTKGSSFLLHTSLHRQATTRIATATYNGRSEFINFT